MPNHSTSTHEPYRTPLYLALLAGLILPACGSEPITVPDAHSALVGIWHHDSLRNVEGEERGKYVRLKISAQGKLAYAWQETSSSISTCSVVGASALTHVDQNRIEAGSFWPLTTELEIDRGPHRAQGRWTMTVEGVELERVADSVEQVGHDYSCADGRLIEQEGEPDAPDEQADGSGTTI